MSKVLIKNNLDIIFHNINIIELYLNENNSIDTDFFNLYLKKLRISSNILTEFKKIDSIQVQKKFNEDKYSGNSLNESLIIFSNNFFNSSINFQKSKVISLYKEFLETEQMIKKVFVSQTNVSIIDSLKTVVPLDKIIDFKDFVNIKDLASSEKDMYKEQLSFFIQKYEKNSLEHRALKLFLKTFFPKKNEEGKFKLPVNSDFKEILNSNDMSFEISFLLRDIYTKKSWTILTEEMILNIIEDIKNKNSKKVIDIGSGSGALVFWLREYLKNENISDIQIIATDDNSWGMSSIPMINDIIDTDTLDFIKNLNINEDSNLYFIGSWLTPRSEMGYDILKEIPINSNFLYIGEGKGGETGTPALHAGFDFSSIDSNIKSDNITFYGIHDYLISYKKNKEISKDIDNLILYLGDNFSNNLKYKNEAIFKNFLSRLSKLNFTDKFSFDREGVFSVELFDIIDLIEDKLMQLKQDEYYENNLNEIFLTFKSSFETFLSNYLTLTELLSSFKNINTFDDLITVSDNSNSNIHINSISNVLNRDNDKNKKKKDFSPSF